MGSVLVPCFPVSLNVALVCLECINELDHIYGVLVQEVLVVHLEVVLNGFRLVHDLEFVFNHKVIYWSFIEVLFEFFDRIKLR